MAHDNAKESAFPNTWTVESISGAQTVAVHGLTKREYFAGLALQGAMANDTLLKHFSEKGFKVEVFCVQYADALLLELSK